MKNYFLLYLDSQELISNLTDKEAGQLLKAFYTYTNTGEMPQLSRSLNLVFLSFKQQLDRDLEAYEKKCQTNRENGSRGGRPRKNPEETDKKSEENDQKNKQTVVEKTQKNQTVFLKTQKTHNKNKNKNKIDILNIINTSTHAHVRERMTYVAEIMTDILKDRLGEHGVEIFAEVLEVLVDICQDKDFAKQYATCDMDLPARLTQEIFNKESLIDNKRGYILAALKRAKPGLDPQAMRWRDTL